MYLASEEFVHVARSILDSWLPARDIVAKASAARSSVSSSGRVLELSTFCPWAEHLHDLEQAGEFGLSPGDILYVVFQDRRGSWRAQAVPRKPGSFENRKPFPSPWRGLRDEELSKAVGIPDGIFIHAAGFIGGAQSRESVLKMVNLAVEWE
jgi:uncharacterized UPF0160 family protein